MNEKQKSEEENNKSENVEEEHHKNCLMCNVVDCFRLDQYQDDNPEVGRELHFGELLFKKIHYDNDKVLASIICKNNSFFESLCFFVNTISEIEEQDILEDSLFLSARDLKASIFLAMTGNYRNAMQVLRCSYETLLFCLYYNLDLQQANDHQEIEKVKDNYKSWINGGVIKRIDVFTELFRRLGVISRQEAREWKRLYNNLSKYIHTPRSTWGKKIKEPNLDIDVSCIANNIFDSSHLKLWSENFRKVFYILIKIGVYFHPIEEIRSIDAGKLAIKIMIEEINGYFEKYPEEKNDENYLIKLLNLVN